MNPKRIRLSNQSRTTLNWNGSIGVIPPRDVAHGVVLVCLLLAVAAAGIVMAAWVPAAGVGLTVGAVYCLVLWLKMMETGQAVLRADHPAAPVLGEAIRGAKALARHRARLEAHNEIAALAATAESEDGDCVRAAAVELREEIAATAAMPPLTWRLEVSDDRTLAVAKESDLDRIVALLAITAGSFVISPAALTWLGTVGWASLALGVVSLATLLAAIVVAAARFAEMGSRSPGAWDLLTVLEVVQSWPFSDRYKYGNAVAAIVAQSRKDPGGAATEAFRLRAEVTQLTDGTA